MIVAGRPVVVFGVLGTAWLATTVSLLAQETDLRVPRVPTATTASASTPDKDRTPPVTVSNHRPAVWRRLHVPDPVAARAARDALDLAHELLSRPPCIEGLSAFKDQSGHALDERLNALSVDFQTYLEMVVFIDGSRETRCTMGAFAFTAPGSRIVRLCVEQLKRTWQQDHMHTVANFIHEMLHTLGLGENPPTSEEITRRVMAACRSDR